MMMNDMIEKNDTAVQTHTWGHEKISTKTFFIKDFPRTENIVSKEFTFSFIMPKKGKFINKIFIAEFKKK